MRLLSNLRIRTKVLLLVVSLAAGLVLTGLASAHFTYQALLHDRTAGLKAVVDIALGIAARLEAQVKAGTLTQAQALDSFRDRLDAMRFDSGQGYIFAYTMEGLTIYAPDPKMIGTNRMNVLTNGVAILQLMRDGVTRSNGPFVFNYEYPKPGQTEISEKMTYVAPFRPWNLMVGTGVYLDSMQTEFASVARTSALLFGGVLLLVMAVSLLIARNITAPLEGLGGAMRRLADGDLAAMQADTGRRDELGAMARALEVFRQNMMAAGRLREEQEAIKLRAEADKKATLAQLAGDFEAHVGASLATLASSSGDMKVTSRAMSATAETTSAQAVVVAESAERASLNVQTVAAATEQLASSVAEIGRQVNQSARIAGQAVSDANRTNEVVLGLSAAARKISEVVQLINSIAGQTNLLALNATIEAARAGDAGKGFAVVASEVKALASQTGQATEEIAAQVAAMQNATDQVVSAIREIGGTIGAMNDIAAAIAAAVEQQGAATSEIARNVQEAAKGTDQVTSTILSVNHAAGETGSAAGQVLASAEQLGAQADALRGNVDDFLVRIRAA